MKYKTVKQNNITNTACPLLLIDHSTEASIRILYRHYQMEKIGAYVSVVYGTKFYSSGLFVHLDRLFPSDFLQGSVAYVPQQAWIRNASLRSNIVFGREFQKDLYNTTIETCALDPDLQILPAGDLTEIGEKVYLT